MKTYDIIDAIKENAEDHYKQVMFHINECIKTQKEVNRLLDQIDELKKYFTSGNDIPVERATILAKDFWKIIGTEE